MEHFELLVKALNAYGPVVCAIAALMVMNGFFIYRDWKREERQQKQIDTLTSQYHDVIVPLVTECKEAIASSKEVIAQNSQLIMGWLSGRR